MRFLASQIALLLALSGSAWAADTPEWSAAKAVLQDNCTKCHGGVKRKGGLDLRAVAPILQGGDSGPAIVPGAPEASLLIEVLQPEGDPSMPPKGPPLTPEETETLTAWVRTYSAAETAETHDGPADLPAGMAPRLVIDFLLGRTWAEQGVTPTPAIDDAAFLRRASLHLLGRIPTTKEREAFLSDTDSTKRERLIDALLQRPEFARHFAELFDAVLLGRSHGLKGRERPLDRSDDWHRYLQWVFATNRPWNHVARDMLSSARPEEDPARGARWFLASRKDDHEAIAKAVAPTLLGKQIACAQCHNHPLVPEIEQRHYWGLVAFFNRSFNISAPHGLDVGESATSNALKFSTLEGESHEAKLAFFTGETVSEPAPGETHDRTSYLIPPSQEYFDSLTKKAPEKKKRRQAPTMEAVPVPKFSRRDAFLTLAVESYPDFARTLVNRVWALLLGRGLIHPVDHLDSLHPPSHPELLDWLSQDFAAQGFDVQRLIREIMASRVYQLSSEALQGQRPPAEQFACGLLQPLTAESLYRSMLVAGGHVPDAEGNFAGIEESAYRQAFAAIYPDLFPETFTPQPAEGLFFSNNAMMEEILRETFSERSPQEVVLAAFAKALGRAPDASELEKGQAFLGDAPSTLRNQALLWALITSSEFRFNH